MYFRNLSLSPAIFLFFLSFLLASSVAARSPQVEVTVKVLASAPQAKVRVEGKLLDAENSGKRWSFLQNYADISGLGERIENLRLFDSNGQGIEYKKFAPGEFDAEQISVSFQYEVKVKAPEILTASAHVSWLAETHGLLMLGDLLPQNLPNTGETKITLELPPDWHVVPGAIETADERKISVKNFLIKDADKAVFLVGKNLRAQSKQVNGVDLTFATVGEWQFTDADALQTAEAIFAEHRKTFGGKVPFPNTGIFLLPFPQTEAANAFERWRAETRGSTVVIISAPTAFKSAALNRLHEQLRHEIFHLWIPNALNLSGNYDWFFEGFTLYQALKTGVRLNQIRFDDFLSTLGRAYDLTEALSRRQSISLIEASGKRWLNSNELIYAKGIVVAFLCDATLLRESKEKKDLDSIFLEIFQKHRQPNQREDGNAAILRVLKRDADLVSVAEKYIEGNSKLDWQSDLATFGIGSEKTSATGTALKVVAKPSGRQKDLLNKLGYNQWRKLLQQK